MKGVSYICDHAACGDGTCYHHIPHEWDDWESECPYGLCAIVEGSASVSVKCIPYHKHLSTVSLRWWMFWEGQKEARQKLHKWENWTPLLYNVAVKFLVVGFLVGVVIGLIVVFLFPGC